MDNGLRFVLNRVLFTMPHDLMPVRRQTNLNVIRHNDRRLQNFKGNLLHYTRLIERLIGIVRDDLNTNHRHHVIYRVVLLRVLRHNDRLF